MKKKLILLLKSLLPAFFLLMACAPRETSDTASSTELTREDLPTEQTTSEDAAVNQEDGTLSIELGEKIIETASLSYETVNFEEALAFVNKQINQHQGHLEFSSRSENSSYGYRGDFISMTIRIPQNNLEAFIENLNQSDQLYSISQEMSRTDVTKTYRDNETRIAVLKEEETALRELLQRQGSLEEVLQIRTRLTEVIAEREIYENENRNYDEQIEFSAVYLNIQQTDRANDRDVSGFWQRLANALGDSFYSFILVMQQLAINLVYLFPYLVILLLGLSLGYFIWKRVRK